jgi:2-haloacid dehalogenase
MSESREVTRREVLTTTAGAVASAIAAGRTPVDAQSQAPVPQGRSPRDAAQVKVVAFDTFGTVVDWRSVIVEEGGRLGKRKGLSVDWAAFADDWRAAYGPSMNRVRTGELPWTKLDVLHRMSLDTVLAKHGVTSLSEAEKRELNRVWHRGRPWPDAVSGLTRLKKRSTIAPLSNGNISLITDMAKAGGLPWDCVLGAELVRHYKPDPEVYMSPVDFFDLTPPEVMFVAAHPSDLDVPRRLGLITAYVHRPREYGTARVVRVPAAGTYDYSVEDFNQLASALGV